MTVGSPFSQAVLGVHQRDVEVAGSFDASLRHCCAVAAHNNANLRNVSRCSHSVACLPASMLSRANQSKTSAMFMAMYSSTVPPSPLCWSRLERAVMAVTDWRISLDHSQGRCATAPHLALASHDRVTATPIW